MIVLNNISKKYDDLQILKDFNLTIEDNSITCLFGPSGVGKTTIANIATGLIPVDEGSVLGIENTLFSYVFQEPRLLEWYSVYDNINFVLKDIYDADTRKNVINNYISMVGLEDFSNYKPKALSGGMAQRVSLARAFAYPSNALIMDEPFKALDIKLKIEMINSFKDLWNKSKRAVLFITHDINEAALLSDTIYIINNRPVEVIKKLKTGSYQNTDEIKSILMSC